MKPFRWNAEKSLHLKQERGVSFESIVVCIDAGGLLDILPHPNPAKYPNQRIIVAACDGYVHLVPVIEEAETYLLKAIIPSRKATRDYADRKKRGEPDAQA